MRTLIDGHVHISRRHALPWTDALTGATLLPNGKMRTPDGRCRSRLPAYFTDSAFPAETLIAVMDENNVEKGAVMAHLDSETCETAVEANEKYPNRLNAAISLEPKLESAEKLAFWHAKGIRILKFEMRSMNEMYPGVTLTDPSIMGMLDTAETLGMTVVVDPSPVSFPSFRPDCMREALQKHPSLNVVICHIALPFQGLKQEPALYAKWRDMISLADEHPVFFDLAAIPDLFVEENFPYPSAMELLHEIYDRYGAGRLIWGSDIPGTFKTATYYQMVQAFERLDFLTETDKQQLFYDNANALYFAGAKTK